jgi:O-antigen ligase
MTPFPEAYQERMLDAARVCLLVTAASLPLSTAVTNLFAALALLCWALSGQWTPAARAIAAEPAAWLCVALFGALAAGVAWSLAPLHDAASMLLKYRNLLLFGVAMFLFAEARWRVRLLSAFLGGAVLLLALSYAISFGLMEYGDSHHFSSTQNAVMLKNPITHGFIMSLLAYGTAVIALRSAGARCWTLTAVALLAAANVWFAVQGRTGYFVLTGLVLWLGYSRWRIKGLGIALFALCVAFAAAFQWAPIFKGRVAQAVEEAQDYRVQAHPGETSIGSRLHFWIRSAQWMAGHPMLGAGTGGWAEAFYEATAGDDAYMHNRDRDHPHNEYINLAVQLGPLGLALFVALLVVAFRRAGYLTDEYAALAQGFVLAFAMGSMFNDLFRDSTESHMWAVLGGALFGASRALPQARRPA